MTVRHDHISLRWLGYATARVAVDSSPSGYTDPGRYGACPAAGSPIAPRRPTRIRDGGRESEPPEALPYDIVRVGYGDTVKAKGVTVEAIPAYNRPDGPWGDVRDGEPLHPEGFGCGYVVSVNDHRWCWPGDSDALDHHRELDVSLFTPPIGAFTMNRQEAAELAGAIGPELVVPIHYNTFEALEADSGAFASDVAKRGVPVALDEG